MKKPRQISRTEFLKLSAMTSIALPVLGFSCSNKTERQPGHVVDDTNADEVIYSDRLGMQVFGVREMLEKDPRGVFKAIADIGIKNIELFDPATLKTYVPIIKDLGMTPLSTHFLPGYISGKWDTVKQIEMTPPENYNFQNIVDDCVTHGVKNLGIAIMMPEERQSMDDFKKFAEMANTHGEICKQAGVQLYYHNHSFEFKPTEGLIPFDEMLKIFDRDLVKIELDVFWVTIANNDPIAWINKIGNQLLFIHMKDLRPNTPIDYSVFEVDPAVFLEIGDGIINFKQSLEAAKAAGVQYAFLDQDHSAMDKIESVKKSYTYLKRLGI
jgi:sugar phosphate isomerase/epimerase